MNDRDYDILRGVPLKFNKWALSYENREYTLVKGLVTIHLGRTWDPNLVHEATNAIGPISFKPVQGAA